MALRLKLVLLVVTKINPKKLRFYGRSFYCVDFSIVLGIVEVYLSELLARFKAGSAVQCPLFVGLGSVE